ncbi:MAG: autotransporter domain-containing protein [Planctomycetes bacterium]|nr:autotransporter domain-containing protein [Planctomycetota bacterium]
MIASLLLALAPSALPQQSSSQAPQENTPPPQLAARTPSSPFSYTYAQFDIVRGDGHGYDSGPTGIDLHGAYEFQQGLFVFGGWTHLGGDVGNASPDTDVLAIGLGFHTPVNPRTDLVFGVDLAHAHTNTGATGGAANGDGYGFDVTLRHLATDQFELNGGLGYSDFNDSDSQTNLHVGAIFRATQNLGVCLNLSTSDDLNSIAIGLRYQP